MRFGLIFLIAASCLALSCDIGRAALQLVDSDNVAEASMLQEAYRTLAKADHDYAGHRKKAMKALETACDLLGKGVAGGGKQERQSVADDELRAAQRIIQRVRDHAAGRDQQEVVKHLDEAINEISLALEAK